MVQTVLDGVIMKIVTQQENAAQKQKPNLKKLVKLNVNRSQPSASARSATETDQETLMESLANSMAEFIYDPETNLTFEAWYARYEDLFTEDGKKLDVAARVRLLLRKLSSPVYTKYADYVLPKHPRDFKFAKTVEMLKKLFGCTDTLFSMRYKCLQTVKMECDDITTYAALVNRRCEDFQLKSLTSDHFKCLMFIMGMPRDTAVRASLLKLMHSEKPGHPVTVNTLVDEIQRNGCLHDEDAMDTLFFGNFLKTPTVEALGIDFPTSKTFHTLKSGTYSPYEVEQALNYLKMSKTEADRQIQDQIAAAFLEGVTLGRKSQTPEPKTVDIDSDLTVVAKAIIEKGNALIARSENYIESLKSSGYMNKVVYHEQYVINYNSNDEKKKFIVYDIKELCITKYNRACALFEMILNGLPLAISSSFDTTLFVRISEIVNVDKAGLNSINVQELIKVLAIMYRDQKQSSVF